MKRIAGTMQHTTKKRLIYTLVFAVGIGLLTSLLRIPIANAGNAYIHLGDALIFVAAIFLGPLFGALAACVGAGASDLIVGATNYVFVTMLIKVAMVVVIWFVFKRVGSPTRLGDYLTPIVIAAAVGALCYFFYNLAILGFWSSLMCLAFDLLQDLGCGLIAIPLMRIAEAKRI